MRLLHALNSRREIPKPSLGGLGKLSDIADINIWKLLESILARDIPFQSADRDISKLTKTLVYI